MALYSSMSNDFSRRSNLCVNIDIVYFISTSSTSNIRVAFGGITPPAPLAPYARSGGIINVAFDPTFNNEIPSSQPLITLPLPNSNSIGWFLSYDESNFVPLLNFPV